MADTKKKNIRIIGEVIFWIIVSILFGFFIFLKVSSGNTQLPVKSFLIQSGSMEPTIKTGDIILVEPTGAYQQRDVITYYDHGDRVVTHRIIEETETNSGERAFITQGDNNQTPDIAAIPESKIIGEHLFTIPKLGYLVAKSKSKAGIIILIIVPASILIYDELKKITASVKAESDKK